jgi:disulfide bond formation protein DsbB
VGILRKDKDLPYYVLPLSIAGTVVALYHTLLQWGVIPQKLGPCVNGISCVTKQLNYLEFITLPFLSFLAFSVITALMFTALPPKGAARV